MNWIKLIIIFFSINSIAIASSLPPLPQEDKEEIQNIETIHKSVALENTSLLQRIKSFLGFKKPIIKKEERNLAQDSNTIDKTIIELGTNKLPVLETAKSDVTTTLSLPSGFQEDIKESNITKPEEIAQTQSKIILDAPRPTDTKPLESIELGTNKLPVLETAKSDVTTTLSLPSGFQEDIKESNITKPEEIAQTQSKIILDAPRPTDTKPLESIELGTNKLPVLEIAKSDVTTTLSLPSGFQEDIREPNITKPKAIPQTQSKITVEIQKATDTKTATTPQPLPIVSKKELALPTKPTIITPATQKRSAHIKTITNQSHPIKLTLEQTKFVDDEAKVLLLPNDDIVLGELSEQAIMDLIDISAYIHLVEKQEEKEGQLDKRTIIENFLANYDDNFHIDPSKIALQEAFYDSLNAVQKDNLFDLRALLDKYPILQKKDEDNETLLHIATSLNSYSLVKFLIMRGIDVNSFNNYHETPLRIAEKQGDIYIAYLLKRAQYK